MTKFALTITLLLTLSTATSAQTTQKARRGWLEGRWEGTAFQTDHDSTWTMSLDERRGTFAVEYHTLDCSGEWRLTRLTRRTRWRATLTETITRNPDRCEPRGHVTLLRLRRDQILYLYSYRNSRTVIASAVLNRK